MLLVSVSCLHVLFIYYLYYVMFDIANHMFVNVFFHFNQFFFLSFYVYEYDQFKQSRMLWELLIQYSRYYIPYNYLAPLLTLVHLRFQNLFRNKFVVIVCVLNGFFSLQNDPYPFKSVRNDSDNI